MRLGFCSRRRTLSDCLLMSRKEITPSISISEELAIVGASWSSPQFIKDITTSTAV
jgi:hypothetical protein